MTLTVKQTALLPAIEWEKPSDILAHNTSDYWRLHKAAAGRSDESITIGTAITQVTELEKRTANSNHTLSVCVNRLSRHLISGAPRRKKAKKNEPLPPTAKVLSLVK